MPSAPTRSPSAAAATARARPGPPRFCVVDGRLEVLVGEGIETADPGDLLVLPPSTPHAFRARPDSPVAALIVMTPGIARFPYFHHVVRQRAGEQSPEVLQGLQDRFDTHFLDSPGWQT